MWRRRVITRCVCGPLRVYCAFYANDIGDARRSGNEVPEYYSDWCWLRYPEVTVTCREGGSVCVCDTNVPRESSCVIQYPIQQCRVAWVACRVRNVLDFMNELN